MLLLMSATFIDHELKSRFGRLPPAFLPLANLRLFQHQIESIQSDEPIYLTLPDSYLISEQDQKWLIDKSVKLIYTPEDLSLGAAIVTALNLIDQETGTPLAILFADTLIPNLPEGNDIIAVSQAEDSYHWAAIAPDHDESSWVKTIKNPIFLDHCQVVCGFFRFSSSCKLAQAITLAQGDFILGLNHYKKEVGLTPVSIDGWLDFGHINTYARSKMRFTTQRTFNELQITSKYVEKSSVENNQKIKAEAQWFLSIPPALRLYLPQYLGDNETQAKFSYRLEYLPLISLNELYVFSETPPKLWRKILKSCFDFLDACTQYSHETHFAASSLNSLLNEKTLPRLAQYCQKNDIALEKNWTYNGEPTISIRQLLENINPFLPLNENDLTIIHGDFCFSNIFYDFITGNIKTLDPRGITSQGEFSCYGDIRYDIAKLSHSILGMYDWIIAGYYEGHLDRPYCLTFNVVGLQKHQETMQFFIELACQRYHLTPVNLYAMQIHLFLSMLPLHADYPKRQLAFIANAFRLYRLMLERR